MNPHHYERLLDHINTNTEHNTSYAIVKVESDGFVSVGRMSKQGSFAGAFPQAIPFVEETMKDALMEILREYRQTHPRRKVLYFRYSAGLAERGVEIFSSASMVLRSRITLDGDAG